MAQLLTEVLQQCRKGDKNAFAVIVQRFQSKALDLAKALIGDKHLAEDAVQSAFLTAFNKLGQLRQDEAFAGWFRQIVRTESLKIVRKNRKTSEEIIEPASNESSPIEKLQQDEIKQLIRKSLNELSETNRQTVELFYLDEQSCSQIANTLNVPAGTVKRRLYDARQKLRESLADYSEPERKTKRKKNEISL